MACEFFNTIEAQASAEHDVAEECDFRWLFAHGGEKALGEGAERLARHDAALNEAALFPARALAAERVKFAVGGQHVDRLAFPLAGEDTA